MSEPTEEFRESDSTYFVQDRSNLEEMQRLDIQDKLLTTAMGDVLPELADGVDFVDLRHVLDVGCGTGGWLIEMARAYPTIERLVGADISARILAYARERATEEHLAGRVQFQVMDALRMLEFPNSSFELVNQRLASSWLRRWEWRKVLLEYRRITRPGGIIRITDADLIESNSPALMKIQNLFLVAFYRSGRFFREDATGLTSALVQIMGLNGIYDVKSRTSTLTYGESVECDRFLRQDMLLAFRVLLPFLQKWTRVPSDYQEIVQQADRDMLEPGFVATWRLVTAWGRRADLGRRLL